MVDSKGGKKGKRGPRPDHLKVEGNWQDAVKEALGKEKPAEGWPEKPKKKGS